MAPRDIVGLILAGGRASRFDGGAKETALFRGKPLIQHVIDRAAPQVARLAVSRPQGESGVIFDLEIVADRHADCGPIAGLYAGLDWMSGLSPAPNMLATFACDTPVFPKDLVRKLATLVSQKNAVAAIASSRGAPHPTFALWPAEILPIVKDRIDRGALSLMGLADAVGAAVADCEGPDEAAFFNVNRREDIAELDRLAEGRR